MSARKECADAIDAYDEEISILNEGKRDTFASYRQRLVEEGHGPDAVKAELAALKAAIKRRRAVAKDSVAVDQHDALTDEVFTEISRTAHDARAYSEAAE